jgi:drug/metabolite transporter (DMT)-like permease
MTKQELSARDAPNVACEEVTVSLIRDHGDGAPSTEQSASDDDKALAERKRTLSTLITVCVCLLFTAVGPMLILTNKYLMARCKFPYPIILTCSGQISSSVICFILVRVFKVVPLTPMSWPFYLRNVFAVGLLASLAMALGNSTYLYLTVAFIEILKGFTPVVTIMVQALFGQGFPRPSVGVAVLMISVGTSISSFGEIDLNPLGVTLMLGSIYSEAMRLMLTQRLLQDLRLHVLETLYFVAPATLFWLLPLAYIFDVRRMNVAEVRGGHTPRQRGHRRGAAAPMLPTAVAHPPRGGAFSITVADGVPAPRARRCAPSCRTLGSGSRSPR